MNTGAELEHYFWCKYSYKHSKGLNRFNTFWACQYLNGYGVQEI